MPEQNDLPLSEYELAYLNGQEHGAPPVLKDVRLTRDSQIDCEAKLKLARDHDKRIRNDSDANRVVDINRQLANCIKQLEFLRESERTPWVRILSQIDAAINPIANQLKMVGTALRQRVTDWQAEVEAGQKAEEARLKAQEDHLRAKAEFASDPKERRQARVAADAIQKEVKATKQREPSVKGVDTVTDYEYEIVNRTLAAKLPEEAIVMEIQKRWFDAKIKEARGNKLPLPTFPGIKITTFTRVRFHR